MTYPEKIKHLEEVIEMLEKEVEVLRMQLVACGVISMSNTKESFVHNQLPQDSPYRCAYYEDCENAVLREIYLLERNAELLEALEETYSLYGMTDDELRTNWGRVFDCVRTAIRKAKGER